MSKENNTTKAVFTHVVHHNEMLLGAQITASGALSVHPQNLADPKGTEGARKSLLDRYKQIRENR